MRQMGILLDFSLRIYTVIYSLLSMPPLYAGTLHSFALPHCLPTHGHATTARVKTAPPVLRNSTSLPTSLSLSTELAHSAS